MVIDKCFYLRCLEIELNLPADMMVTEQIFTEHHYRVHDDVGTWRHLQHNWPVWEGNQRSVVVSTHKRIIMRSFDVVLDVVLNKLFNTQLICR